MTVQAAADALAAAIATVPGVRVYTDPAAVVDPPGAVVGPPALRWEALATDPTSATFVVYVAVAVDSRALSRLWDLVPQVVAAIEASRDVDATIDHADPGTWLSGGAELPCYEVTVEVAL